MFRFISVFTKVYFKSKRKNVFYDMEEVLHGIKYDSTGGKKNIWVKLVKMCERAGNPEEQ